MKIFLIFLLAVLVSANIFAESAEKIAARNYFIMRISEMKTPNLGEQSEKGKREFIKSLFKKDGQEKIIEELKKANPHIICYFSKLERKKCILNLFQQNNGEKKQFYLILDEKNLVIVELKQG